MCMWLCVGLIASGTGVAGYPASQYYNFPKSRTSGLKLGFGGSDDSLVSLDRIESGAELVVSPGGTTTHKAASGRAFPGASGAGVGGAHHGATGSRSFDRSVVIKEDEEDDDDRSTDDEDASTEEDEADAEAAAMIAKMKMMTGGGGGSPMDGSAAAAVAAAMTGGASPITPFVSDPTGGSGAFPPTPLDSMSMHKSVSRPLGHSEDESSEDDSDASDALDMADGETREMMASMMQMAQMTLEAGGPGGSDGMEHMWSTFMSFKQSMHRPPTADPVYKVCCIIVFLWLDFVCLLCFFNCIRLKMMVWDISRCVICWMHYHLTLHVRCLSSRVIHQQKVLEMF